MTKKKEVVAAAAAAELERIREFEAGVDIGFLECMVRDEEEVDPLVEDFSGCHRDN